MLKVFLLSYFAWFLFHWFGTQSLSWIPFSRQWLTKSMVLNISNVIQWYCYIYKRVVKNLYENTFYYFQIIRNIAHTFLKSVHRYDAKVVQMIYSVAGVFAIQKMQLSIDIGTRKSLHVGAKTAVHWF